MKGNSLNSLVAGMAVGKTRNAKSKEYAHASEWPKCSIAGCPLPTTIKAETCTCGYHYREHGLSADCITEAIKEHTFLLNKYYQMLRWDIKKWNESRAAIMGWPVLPATEADLNFPTAYLVKLKSFIDNSIKDKSVEFYNYRAK
ncbi:MAG: hypothetical protein JKY50_00330 [Oleispira sp.]|nr:hypothetical protein [Oleispira sp.]